MTPNQIKVLVTVANNTRIKGSRFSFYELEECLSDMKFGFLARALEELNHAGFIGKKKTDLRLTQRGWNIFRAIKEVWDG